MRNIDTSKLHDTSSMLDRKYGKRGTETRDNFEKEAIAHYYGEILKDKRKELKLTQESLAEKVGLKRSYIAKIEKGETDLQISSLVRLANALGLKFSLS
ncbi:MAG: helix-turn-helix domain-containing protein [Dysgonomonas mossii]|uniref:helix-turn-helix domain-containing protein n=1 Tax=Dysgonomonas mossii TaxID=163665 RepID=UPI001D66BA34|nr:helix-turn-helix transcriptional regulator [Dysgonomonas mossii]MBS5795401.1 helix-turn-helix domain-containing protein [Dysgonomonas mossii]MBS7109929.1 helix-turn-helix domain-containing protein [Dysgonomonas mossii]